jgi:hypothetical protein
MRRALTIVGAATAIGLAGVATATAEETSCRGTLGRVTVDNLRVPQGATCDLRRTRVKGTIKVDARATLRARAIRVIGNVQAENHRSVWIRGRSRIDGSVQVVQGSRFTLRSSVVGSDVQAFENDGRIVIAANRIDGNLQCKENARRPAGGGNVVQGNKEDQCAAL